MTAERPYFNYSGIELEKLYMDSIKDNSILKLLLQELQYRSTSNAVKLKKKIENTLSTANVANTRTSSSVHCSTKLKNNIHEPMNTDVKKESLSPNDPKKNDYYKSKYYVKPFKEPGLLGGFIINRVGDFLGDSIFDTSEAGEKYNRAVKIIKEKDLWYGTIKVEGEEYNIEAIRRDAKKRMETKRDKILNSDRARRAAWKQYHAQEVATRPLYGEPVTDLWVKKRYSKQPDLIGDKKNNKDENI